MANNDTIKPKERPTWAMVRWVTEDIHNAREEAGLPPISESRAEEWLDTHEKRLEEIMIERGWDYINNMIDDF